MCALTVFLLLFPGTNLDPLIRHVVAYGGDSLSSFRVYNGLPQFGKFLVSFLFFFQGLG